MSLPLSRYHLTFKITSPLHLYRYPGSTLRGAFGKALLKISCMTKMMDCSSCPLQRTCPYPLIFETPLPKQYSKAALPQVPQAYIIEPPVLQNEYVYNIDDTLTFSMVLLGEKALQQLPLVIFAWQQAFKHGVGKLNGKGKLLKVEHENHGVILDANEQEPEIQEHEQVIDIKVPDNKKQLNLEFITPLRLKVQQHPDGNYLKAEEVQISHVLMALVRRIEYVNIFHLHQNLNIDRKQLSEYSKNITATIQWQWQTHPRYSFKQQKKLFLSGMVGQWALQGDLEPFLWYLYLGQWVHVGNSTSFGLGKYFIIL